MVTELNSALRHPVGNLFFQLFIYCTTCNVTSARGLTTFRRLLIPLDTNLCGRSQCPFCVSWAVPLLCVIGSMVPVWSMCLFLVMWARESLQPFISCIRSSGGFFYFIWNVFLGGIFNYFLIFNYGMCNFLDRVTVWKPVSVIRRLEMVFVN